MGKEKQVYTANSAAPAWMTKLKPTGKLDIEHKKRHDANMPAWKASLKKTEQPKKKSKSKSKQPAWAVRRDRIKKLTSDMKKNGETEDGDEAPSRTSVSEDHPESEEEINENGNRAS